jgi:ribosome biogenesis GTPase
LIEGYGWTDALRQAFAPHAARGLVPGRVIIQRRSHYVVVTDEGEVSARLSGRFVREAREAGYPAVGDWVGLARRDGEGTATIQVLSPRRTAFTRKAADREQTVQVVAANVDVALLVTAMNAEFSARRLERYLASAWQSGARPVVVLTKADLSDDPAAAVAEARRLSGEAPVIAVSCVSGEGLDTVRAHLRPGETAVLVGSSGAGKSTLVNALFGEVVMSTGEIRENDARGRHTTTHRELILLPSGPLVLDTPGMRELALMDAGEGVDAAFEEIEALSAACRFHDCGHTNEPGCAVRAALLAGELDPDRWASFQKLRAELAELVSKEDRGVHAAERRRGVAASKAAKAAKKTRVTD